MAERIKEENFEEKVLKSNIPVLVEFYTDSCVPCKMMSPILGDLEDDTEGKLSVYKVNANYDEELAVQYGVRGTPTFLCFEKGEVKERKAGAVKKDELYDWVSDVFSLELV